MTSKTREALIVGGGIAGLAVAERLARAGVATTLFEEACLGAAASTRNQGWLHSGAWFAPQHAQLARLCYESLNRTIAGFSDCLEPGIDGFVYVLRQDAADADRWTTAWTKADLPFRELSPDETLRRIPGVKLEPTARAFLLPDRVFHPDRLIELMADRARAAGVEIHCDKTVTRLISSQDRIEGIAIGDQVWRTAGTIVLAAGAQGSRFWAQVADGDAGGQPTFTLVALKGHLLAIEPRLPAGPFCVLDAEGFNHVPRGNGSIFSANRWQLSPNPSDLHGDEQEFELIWRRISEILPELSRNSITASTWAGATVQAMHVDQIEPGQAPLPTVINHAEEAPVWRNLLTVFPGRATLFHHVADEVERILCTDR